MLTAAVLWGFTVGICGVRVSGLCRQTDRYGECGIRFVVCTDRLTDMTLLVGGLWFVRQTDRYGKVGRRLVGCAVRHRYGVVGRKFMVCIDKLIYGEGGSGFVGCTDRLREMVSLLGSLWFV
jgi:hypothetical protein